MSAFQPSSAATSDRLVNKVAMCGALFAGVAFVGYRIVKNAVKKNRNRSDQANYLLSTCFETLMCIDMSKIIDKYHELNVLEC